jgi:peptidoglycan/xylan/chitin deacetylase (PgdA/CDA1 family)
MSDRPYRHSPLPRRPQLTWPNGGRLAVYVTLNLEHFERGLPAIALFQGTASFQPDPLNEGWRDYGPRVGVWRLVDVFDRLELPITAGLNSDVCHEYPEIVAAGVERAWTWVAHGKNNTTLQVGMDEETERAYLREVVETIEQGTGTRPRGWLGPVLTETANTPRLLAELGVDYLLDWSHDEQPAPFEAGGDRMVTVPYASELNDIPAFLLHHHTGEQFAQALVEACDVMLANAEHTGLVLGIGVHPFLVAQPHRIAHFERALANVLRREGVWATTAEAIADSYRAQTG